ncbi:protein FAM204A-like isoform X2 [Dermacentor albipictus]|uniref:protein FAM204A-like isoform X2 n=1 Tax=Dermacentor albipictus TaxID=60249 RepID=UPI0038FC8FF1
MGSTEEELDLSEIDVFAARPRIRKTDPKSQLPKYVTGDTGSIKLPAMTVSAEFKERLAIASLEAGSLRERNMAVRRRIEQRRMARHRRRQQASSTEGNSCEEEPGDQQKWQEVRPFLSVNDHLCGPVSHGSCGPKFAVKIADAFAAKRCAEEQEAKRRRDYVKRQTKLPWGFEAKERWQMKGNM